MIFQQGGIWSRWADKIEVSAAAQLNSPTGGQSQQEQGDEESLIIPTAETVKQNYFLDLAIANCIPLGTY